MCGLARLCSLCASPRCAFAWLCLAVELHLSAKLLNFWPGQDARMLHSMRGERERERQMWGRRSATRFCGCHYVFCPVTHTQTHRDTQRDTDIKLSFSLRRHVSSIFPSVYFSRFDKNDEEEEEGGGKNVKGCAKVH